MGFLISIFLALRFRKSLNKEAPGFRNWDTLFSSISIICAVSSFLLIPLANEFPVQLIGYGIMSWMIYLGYKEPAVSTQRSVLLSVMPLAVIYFLKSVTESLFNDFYKQYYNYFEIATSVGWVWFAATLIMQQRQLKALKAEQALREAEARENRMNAARKAELEILVNERTAELQQQNEKLQQALHELSAAQKQLIHSEKMASLGELTAGIAHEIQNPLNFVNNFSELNGELAGELLDAIQEKDYDEAVSLAKAIRENESKVTHHGKRADSIVKSMLQHSRGGTGARENVNLNHLADECVRLSYHGMRAKEKSFNASIETHFDESIGEISVIPEEISRVLLNICTNAFYAVLQKTKQGKPGYQPGLWLTTSHTPDWVIISIRDNGGGIPEDVREKIFQPFFTTKPTGEGTGLGLSMSFDIVTKGHGGELTVHSVDGEGATFTIKLPKSTPISNNNNT